MTVSLQQISSLVNQLAPKDLAADWDNVGLQVGSYDAEVDKVLVALDVNQSVIKEASELDVDLIISHHPIIFNELSAVKFDTAIGKIIKMAIKNDIAIYSAHTNYDIAAGGLNDLLAHRLGIKNATPLQVTNVEELRKLVVYIPEKYLEQVRDALGELGAGWLGNYSHCAFYQSGTGTFKPLKGSNPQQGEQNKVNHVSEYRLETIIKADDTKKTINKLKDVHPYEEVAYDLYPLTNQGAEFGLGRIGELEFKVELTDYIDQIKEELELEQIKFVTSAQDKVKKVALCSGSGADFIKAAAWQGADLFITGDVKYHEAQLAEELELNLIDAGHYGTEKIMREGLTDYLKQQTTDNNLEVEIIKSIINTNPWQVK
ncbi:MAG: Nif3-like dinuclear metal center hexameric protein [Bacillota bacterium]